VVLKIIAHSNIVSCRHNDSAVSEIGLLIIRVTLQPGTPLFQRYARCPWTLPTSTTPLDLASPLSLFRKALPAGSASGGGGDAPSYLSPSAASATSASGSGTLSVGETGTVGAGKSAKRDKGKKRATSPTGKSASSRASSAQSAQSTGSSIPEQKSPGDGEGGGAEGEGDNEGKVATAPDAMILDRTGEGGMDGVIGMGQSRLVGLKGVIVEEDERAKGMCSVLVYK
jgi:hypothetical protein